MRLISFFIRRKRMKKIFVIVMICVLVISAVTLSACDAFGGKAIGIESIEKTGTKGLVDTYTITMTDGSTSTFTVTNGIGSDSLASDTYTPEHYFRFELQSDDSYAITARYEDMCPTVVIPREYNGKAVTKIPNYGFQIRGVDTMVIPTSITSIGRSMLINKDGYRFDVDYRGTKAQWDAIQKDSEWNQYGNIRAIHCTDGDIILGE